MLARVAVGEYIGFRPFSLCDPFTFGFVCLEVERSFDLVIAEFLQELHNFFGVTIVQGVIVFCKVFPDCCDAFLIQL